MLTWSTRTALFLTVCAPALGIPTVFAATANAQVSAANTIAPTNTVVSQPLPTVKPTTASARVAVSSTGARVKRSRSARAAASFAPASIAPASTAPASAATLSGRAPVGTEFLNIGAPPASTAGASPASAAAANVAPVAPVDSSAMIGPVEASSFSDPLADLASAALLVITASATGAVAGTGQSLPPAIEVIAAPPAPAIQFAVTPPTIDPNTPRPPNSLGTSSVIINTADLGDYVVGTAIAATVSRESQAVLAALPTSGSDRYRALLRAMANVVGPRTKTDPAALEAVWARTDPRRMKAILTAMAQVGTRYHYSGNKPGGFDCSGLTSYAWSQAGVKIPRTSSLQYEGLPRKGAGELLPGDIIWHPGHVSMYLGVDQAVVDAPQTGKTVLVKKASPSSFVSFHNPY